MNNKAKSKHNLLIHCLPNRNSKSPKMCRNVGRSNKVCNPRGREKHILGTWWWYRIQEMVMVVTGDGSDWWWGHAPTPFKKKDWCMMLLTEDRVCVCVCLLKSKVKGRVLLTLLEIVLHAQCPQPASLSCPKGSVRQQKLKMTPI